MALYCKGLHEHAHHILWLVSMPPSHFRCWPILFALLIFFCQIH